MPGDPTPEPDPKLRDVVKRRLGPGGWVDGNDHVHLNAEEINNLFGFPNTPEGLKETTEMLAKILREQGFTTMIRHSKDSPS